MAAPREYVRLYTSLSRLPKFGRLTMKERGVWATLLVFCGADNSPTFTREQAMYWMRGHAGVDATLNTLVEKRWLDDDGTTLALHDWNDAQPVYRGPSDEPEAKAARRRAKRGDNGRAEVIEERRGEERKGEENAVRPLSLTDHLSRFNDSDPDDVWEMAFGRPMSTKQRSAFLVDWLNTEGDAGVIELIQLYVKAHDFGDKEATSPVDWINARVKERRANRVERINGADAARTRARSERERRFDEELARVREAMTPEERATFDEHNAQQAVAFHRFATNLGKGEPDDDPGDSDIQPVGDAGSAAAAAADDPA